MLIDCICGESKFAINAEQIGFDGRLVKCGKCGKEWFQESKLDIVEKKLADFSLISTSSPCRKRAIPQTGVAVSIARIFTLMAFPQLSVVLYEKRPQNVL